jgi:pyroglutamyl-peptidase
MKKILLTGFEPFGGDSLNPSEEIARQLSGSVIARHEIAGALLPCVFGAALKELKILVRRHEPALVICTGQAAGRSEITPERVAINVDDARVVDNAGQQPVDKPVIKGGPVAYWSTLPIKAIVQEQRKRGVPAAISQTAGTFVCNHIFYGLMHELRTWPGVRGGFIHLPHLPEQANGGASMPFEQMTTGMRLAIETAVTYRRDVKAAGGRET